MFNYPYLTDSDFLKEFDRLKVKEQSVKITLLDFHEKQLKEIVGKVISGSITVDGSSSLRRTCNLTMVADPIENDLTNINQDISINKRINLEIGIKNDTDKYTEFPDIWFPQGKYIIFSASISKQASGQTTISLQLKDKMCLLSGECGGVIPAAVDFQKAEELDADGNIFYSYPTIYQIIQELVHHWGGEPLHKIIINDIDTKVKQVMKWTGKDSLYLNLNPGEYNNYDTSENGEVALEFKPQEDVGFIYTDFIYPYELTCNAGESVTSVLDKIKDTLGNYEYFYDIDGNFIFQEKRNYLNTSFSTSLLDRETEVSLNDLSPSAYFGDYVGGKTVYAFGDGELISVYTTTPRYDLIKNDFVI